jgi:hypothetical protein
MKHVLSLTCFLIGVLLTARGAAQSEESDAYGSWMKRPPAEWPKIAVVNQIDYVDQHYPVAGCGFLLVVENEVLAATAKHVLTYFKSPKMDSVDFGGTLESWKMFPKNHPSDMIVVDALLNRDTGESLKGIPCEKGWLLFTIRQRSENIQPLRFRTTPLEKNEPVYVIGWRYTEKDCPQIVYEGKYVNSERGEVLITAEKLVDNTIPGLSGAPVIDEKGYLVGLMSRGKGEIQRLSPVEYPREFLKGRSQCK